MNVSQLLVQALERNGVKYAFGYPGDESLPFMEAVRQSDQMDFVLTRHEAGAGFMAGVYGHLTGELAVAMSTLGAGATNLATPVASAWLAEYPMLVITGQKPILDNRQGRYQLIDVVDVMGPITKFSATVNSPEALPHIVADAIHQALEFPQGPVHIELPLDVAQLDVAETALLPPTVAHTPGPSPSAVEAVVERLKSAKRPLVLLGAGANSRHTLPDALRRFIDHTGIFAISTMMGKGVIDERSEQYVGTAGMPGMGIPNCAVQHADVIVSIGHNMVEKSPFIMSPDGPEVIHVHERSATPDTIWFPQLQLLGDMALSMDALTAALDPLPGWDLDGFSKLSSAFRMAIDAPPALEALDGVLKPQAVASVIRGALEPDDVLALDNGIHKLWLTRNYFASQPRGVIVDSALGSMGTGVPSAVAAKLVHPDQHVLAVVGDGGFMMTGGELDTAVRLQLDLVVVVFNDGGLGMIRLKQSMMGLDNYGVDFPSPDIVGYAKAHGAHGSRVETTEELEATLANAFASGGVHVIDVPVDYRENGPLMQSMKMIDCSAMLGS